MRRPRTLIIAVAGALAIVAAAGFSRPNAPAHLTAPSHGGQVNLGPIPCWDGSTVEFGQFCPVPKFQCADGTSVPLGQFCPRAPVIATPLPQPTPTALPLPTPTALPLPTPTALPKPTPTALPRPLPTPTALPLPLPTP